MLVLEKTNKIDTPLARLIKKTRNISNRKSNFIPQTPGKRGQKHPKISKRKEIIKIRAEINAKKKE